MEALLEKEGTVESWNDERLDELARRMDKGFEEAATKVEMNLRFDRVDERFKEVDRRLDGIDTRLLQIEGHLGRMNNTLLLAAFGVIGALIANGVLG
jgi:hypothetical protein